MTSLVSEAARSPKDLLPLQYSAWICENACAIPANKTNTVVVSDAIRSIARTNFRAEKWKHPEFTAFIWLVRRIENAQLQKIPVDHLFFLNGAYNDVTDVEKKLPEFVPCGNCTMGWVYNEDKSVRRCDCWNEYRKGLAA